MESQHFTPVKIMVCVDNTPESRVAVRFACAKAAKAQRRGGLVDLLHVIEPADFQGLGGVVEKIQADRHAEGETLLQDLAHEANFCEGIRPSLQLRQGVIGPRARADADRSGQGPTR